MLMKNFVNSNSIPAPHIHLYNDPSVKNLNLSEIAGYLEEKLGKIPIDVKSALVPPGDAIDDFAKRFATVKVRDLNNPHVSFEPLHGEIEYEKRILRDPHRKLFGVLYDGFKLQAVVWGLVPEEERGTEHIHVVFTNRLFGTWNEGDRRYHARVSVYGFPSIISTTGIVEAPAKPKEFYLLKQQYAALGATGVPLEILKEKFRGRFIDYDDERLTEIMKGYVMQAIFYHLASGPFCDDERCRLHNAHWQEGVLKAQLEPPEFCKKHEKMLKQWREAWKGQR